MVIRMMKVIIVELMGLSALTVTTAAEAAMTSVTCTSGIAVVSNELGCIVVIFIIWYELFMSSFVVKTDVFCKSVPHIFILLITAWNFAVCTIICVMVTSAVAALQNFSVIIFT